MKKNRRVTSFLIGISSVFVVATCNLGGPGIISGATVSLQNNTAESCPYTVQKGDTLSRIALRLTGKAENYTQIMRFNGLTSDIIRPADQLNIPKQVLLEKYQCSSDTPPPKESEDKILAEIEGIVFEDKNENGRYDADEPGVPEVNVVLIRGRVIQTSDAGIHDREKAQRNSVLIRSRMIQTSDAEGKFLFVDVEPGPQAVGLDETSLPDRYRLVTDSTVVISLMEGDKGSVTFGLRSNNVYE